MHPAARHNVALLAFVSELLAAPLPATATEPATRVSETASTARSEWDVTGFRLQLRFGWEQMHERAPAPPLGAVAVSIEPGWRLTRWFSVGAGLRYSVINSDPWRGVRWSTTLDGTLHPWNGAFLALGGGYGGMLMQKQVPPSYYVVTPQEQASPPKGFKALVRCNGDGAVVLARAGFLLPIAAGFSTGPVIQGDLQATRCAGNYVDPRVAAWARSVEWWWYSTIQVGWSLAWR